MNSLISLIGAPEFEWVVIDGGSEVAKGDEDVNDQVKLVADQYISEPDEGVYDAMNKGTSLATGEYLLYLNAGDELHSDFEPGMLVNLTKDSNVDMVWGSCQECFENGLLVQVKTRSPSWAWYGMPVYHPAIFFRRKALGEKPYDVNYRIAADYDLVCRLLKKGSPVVRLDSIVSIFHRGGLSEMLGSETREEENQIRLKYFGIPRIVGNAIKNFKGVNAKLSRIIWLRRLWRSWI